MKRSRTGFTLVEILIAMTVLLVGLVGILALFPVGLDATRKAIEDSNAAFIAESAYAGLRASVKQMTTTNLSYFHDGIPTPATTYNIQSLDADGKSFGIPQQDGGTGVQPAFACNIATDANFCRLGEGLIANRSFNLSPLNGVGNITTEEWQQLNQYSFNIELTCRNANPRGLFDVVIRVRRGVGNEARLVKKFYTQIAILN